MAYLLPHPSSVKIKNSDPEEYFPTEFNDPNIPLVTKETGSYKFGLERRSYRLYAITSRPNGTEGCILSFGIPCMGLGLSTQMALNYEEPIGCLSSLIDTSKTWTAMVGYKEHDKGNNYKAEFSFGLSGFYSNNDSNYHFRWVFINHSCAKASGTTLPENNPSLPYTIIFYRNADSDIELYEKIGSWFQYLSTITERKNAGESTVTSGSYYFKPPTRRCIFEMFMDRISMDGLKPTTVVFQEKKDSTRKEYSINQDSWGKTSAGKLSCEGIINKDKPNEEHIQVILQPFNLSSATGASQQRNFCTFGMRERINDSTGSSTSILPIPMEFNAATTYYGKTIKPIADWVPAAWTTSPEDVEDEDYADGVVDKFTGEVIPFNIDSRVANTKDLNSGLMTTAGYTKDYSIFYNENNIPEEPDPGVVYRFSHWDAHDNVRAGAETIAPSSFDRGTISANYMDDSLVLGIEVAENGKDIIETTTGTKGVVLSSTHYEPNKGRDLILGGYHHIPSETYNIVSAEKGNAGNGGVDCMSFGRWGRIMVGPDIVECPNPLSGDTITFMGWFNMEHNGNVFWNTDGTLTKYNPSNANFDALMRDPNRKEDETIINNIPYIRPHSLGGWGRLGYLIGSGSIYWDGSRFRVYDNPYYADVNTNGSFNGFDYASDFRYESDPRKCLNITVSNYDAVLPTSTLSHVYTYIQSTGQLVKSGMSGYTPNSDLPSILTAFNTVSCRWTFIATSYDPGGIAGIYTSGRATRLGYMRNSKATLVTNPSLRNLSASIFSQRQGTFATIERDTPRMWLNFGTTIGGNTGINELTSYPGLWVSPAFKCKYLKIYNRAFSEAELDTIYNKEKGMFPSS